MFMLRSHFLIGETARCAYLCREYAGVADG